MNKESMWVSSASASGFWWNNWGEVSQDGWDPKEGSVCVDTYPEGSDGWG
jgi:hypothetical protein